MLKNLFKRKTPLSVVDFLISAAKKYLEEATELMDEWKKYDVQHNIAMHVMHLDDLPLHEILLHEAKTEMYKKQIDHLMGIVTLLNDKAQEILVQEYNADLGAEEE